MVDVTTSEVTGSAFDECRCAVDDVLKLSTKNVVKKLILGMITALEEKDAANKMGDIFISSEPGASVFLDESVWKELRR
jgi:hypothetical protein